MSKLTIKAITTGNLKSIRDNLRSRTVDVIIDTLNEAYEVSKSLEEAGKRKDFGNTDVYLTPPQIDEANLSGKLILRGSDSLFVEYGAGDLTDPPELAGTYSETKGIGMYAENGYWYWGGKKWTGIRAFHPIYWGGQTARKYLEEHGHEVFEE